MSVLEKTFWDVEPKIENVADKITIIGTGMAGMACAVSLLSQGISSNLVLIDINEDKARGEVLDLQHGSLIIKCPKISGGGDYALTANSRICIIAAGLSQKTDVAKQDLLVENTDIIVKIISNLIPLSPETILIVLTNPCDAMAYIAWKVSGLPAHKVIGLGTVVDTSRFKFLIAQKFNCSASSVHGWIIGAHGDNSLALWSGVNVAGVRLQAIHPDIGTDSDKENWAELHRTVINLGKEIVKLKGATSWAVAMCAVSIAKSILWNSLNVLPVSTNINGTYGITEDVFVPIPCVIGAEGVTDIVNLHLSGKECSKFLDCVKLLQDTQNSISLAKYQGDCHCRRCAL